MNEYILSHCRNALRDDIMINDWLEFQFNIIIQKKNFWLLNITILKKQYLENESISIPLTC